ncbi:E3 SUMO-protein ligase ZBED1-like [Coregonus clupeaformis]|uniref:E3 SUMO-protein ligase ZBED1-like n=1 Tax=Coregonus clupeaformis TaxID=59861 RepID=UPI001E1C8AD9|nr:E3 SUMO-protein ligase ZBED1-like [Coregonus clupeaformis]
MVLAARLNEWTRLQCFGHRLHLAIENALKDDRVSRATALCRKLVGHFSHSWKKKAALTEAQRELKLPEHNLITECPTRWGSKEMMIARVLEQAKAISQVLSGDRYARSLIPTWQDIDVLESIHKALHPLLEFTDALSGEEYVSISYLKPVLHLFATSVLAEDAEDTDLTKSIKTKVLAYLNNKYGDPNIQELLDVACFLDPRFKIQYISTDNIPAIKTRLKTEIVDLAQRTYHWEKRSRTETVQMPQSAQSLGEKTKRSLGSFFKTSSASPSLPVNLEDVAEAEINNYLMTPTIDGEDDPLAWWRVHKISYPQLCTMARKYLCVPAQRSPQSFVSVCLSLCFVYVVELLVFTGFKGYINLPRETLAMREYINEALIEGHIRPSTSPAGAGFFFVRKKDALTQTSLRCFAWTPEAGNAFDALKRCFTSVLGHPDPSQPFIVEVDASDVAVGTILSQRFLTDVERADGASQPESGGGPEVLRLQQPSYVESPTGVGRINGVELGAFNVNRTAGKQCSAGGDKGHCLPVS